MQSNFRQSISHYLVAFKLIAATVIALIQKTDATSVSKIAPRPMLILGSSSNELSVKRYDIFGWFQKRQGKKGQAVVLKSAFSVPKQNRWQK